MDAGFVFGIIESIRRGHGPLILLQSDNTDTGEVYRLNRVKPDIGCVLGAACVFHMITRGRLSPEEITTVRGQCTVSSLAALIRTQQRLGTQRRSIEQEL